MAQGLFTLKQVNQALRQGAWSSASTTPVYAATFNGSSQYLNVSSATIAATGQFCIEAWVFQTGRSVSSSQGIFSQYSAGVSGRFYFRFNADKLSFTTSAGDNISTSSVYVNTWYHVAVTRDASNVLRMFINGVLDYNATVTQSLLVANAQIAAIANGENWQGYISNLRTVSGSIPTSYQTSSTTNGTVIFTPPTTNLTTTSQGASNTSLLTLQNATIIDNSSNAYTITNNGTVAMSLNYGVFNPTIKTSAVEYLVVAGGGAGGSGGGGGGGAGGLLTGLYPVSTGSAITVTVGAGGGTGPSPGNASNFGNLQAVGGGQGATTTSNGASGGSGGGGSDAGKYGGQGTANQGNVGGSGSNGGTVTCGGGGGAGTIGLSSASNTPANGGAGVASAISGTVTVYAGGGGGGGANNGGDGGVGGGGGGSTGSHTSSAGTANTGGGGGGAYYGANSAGGSGIVIISYPDVYAAPTSTTGSPTVSTSGSGSIYNAGAGTVQFTGTATPFTFTGDFTIEGWYNLANFNNAAGGGNPSFVSSGSTSNWLVAIPGGTYVFYSGGSLILQTSAVASANIWNHFAIVRSGTTLTIYHNGTSVGTATLSGTVTGASTTTVTANGTGGVGSVTGYMSNVRIVKGTAVYTGAFTPSTIPLTAISNTQLLMNAMSGGYLVDGSTNSFTPTTSTTSLAWNQLSPFSVTGYKNRVYTWTSSGSITF